MLLIHPGIAAAAVFPADTDVWVEGNTIRATITLPDINGPENEIDEMTCRGPWVHTKASADRILNSPDIDLDSNPAGWLVHQPDSPSTWPGGDNPFTTRFEVYDGMSGEATIPAVADGDYVAGVLCGRLPAGQGGIMYDSYRLFPLTVGSPATTPDANGSLEGVGFGSS
ncbi:hypothetical protein [Rhodococcus sp. RD6.2]|uniref:hypothetical protein n=1 Tax=Rhodococcus sp. RD6.2 TaxID=260936 RepID=UPI00067863A0|nr:hypothetical protein [Rhodococcus sp. RD6.2]